jgi:ribosome-binding protein aMBF1 (putative translation factor)
MMTTESKMPGVLRNSYGTLGAVVNDPKVTDERPALLDIDHHDRRMARRLADPATRAEFELELRRVREIDRVVNELDVLRVTLGMSKAELARRIGKNPAAMRRLFTAGSANPRLSTLVDVAGELGVEIQFVVPSDAAGSPGTAAA